MAKKKNVLLFGIMLLLIPFFKVNAAECTNDNLALLKNWASNVNYDYSYIENKDNAVFKIRFTNLNQNIALKDLYHNKTYDINKTEIVIDGFPDGKSYAFEIIAKDHRIIMREMSRIYKAETIEDDARVPVSCG